MRAPSCLAAALTCAFVLTGCQALGVSQTSSYSAPLRGDFADMGEFVADFGLVLDYDAGTFAGEIRDFHFPVQGFHTPSGSVPVTGTLSRNAEGDLALKGKGEGKLTEGDLNYAVEMEVESYFISDDQKTITGGYWGGGDFTRGATYLVWPALKGKFRAEAVCQPDIFRSAPCTLPPPLAIPSTPEG